MRIRLCQGETGSFVYPDNLRQRAAEVRPLIGVVDEEVMDARAVVAVGVAVRQGRVVHLVQLAVPELAQEGAAPARVELADGGEDVLGGDRVGDMLGVAGGVRQEGGRGECGRVRREDVDAAPNRRLELAA